MIVMYFIAGLCTSFLYDTVHGARSRPLIDEMLFQLAWPYHFIKLICATNRITKK